MLGETSVLLPVLAPFGVNAALGAVSGLVVDVVQFAPPPVNDVVHPAGKPGAGELRLLREQRAQLRRRGVAQGGQQAGLVGRARMGFARSLRVSHQGIRCFVRAPETCPHVGFGQAKWWAIDGYG